MNPHKEKKRIFSGIQPTGNIHIGNYLGAVKNWVESQSEFDNIFCIVDLHAITIPHEAKVLKNKTRELAVLLLAAGIDPDKSALFTQSHVSEHSELAWILNCQIPLGWMERMTQFKEKSQKHKERSSLGLLAYPSLMAADILLYDSDGVPVGDDQKQHVELTRDIAQRFNARYGETFKVPEPIIPNYGERIKGLDDPEKKMSKSETSANHAVFLLDTPDLILKKIKRAKTDSHTEIVFDENRPAIINLLNIYKGFTGGSREDIEKHFDGKGYGALKKEIAESVIEGLRPIREKYDDLISDPEHVENILKKGAESVKSTAQATMLRVKQNIGLI